MTYQEELEKEIDEAIERLDLMVSANNGLCDYLISQQKAKIYEREQEMGALTGGSDERY